MLPAPEASTAIRAGDGPRKNQQILLKEDISRDAVAGLKTHDAELPGVDVVPDYESRIVKMREAGIDRDTFIRKVYLPTLKLLGVTRHEMLAGQRAAIEAKQAREAAAPSSAAE